MTIGCPKTETNLLSSISSSEIGERDGKELESQAERDCSSGVAFAECGASSLAAHNTFDLSRGMCRDRFERAGIIGQCKGLEPNRVPCLIYDLLLVAAAIFLSVLYWLKEYTAQIAAGIHPMSVSCKTKQKMPWIGLLIVKNTTKGSNRASINLMF